MDGNTDDYGGGLGSLLAMLLVAVVLAVFVLSMTAFVRRTM